MREPWTLRRVLCRLSGHRIGRSKMHGGNASGFVDRVTGRVVSWWSCSCGYTFMSDGRWRNAVFGWREQQDWRTNK